MGRDRPQPQQAQQSQKKLIVKRKPGAQAAKKSAQAAPQSARGKQPAAAVAAAARAPKQLRRAHATVGGGQSRAAAMSKTALKVAPKAAPKSARVTINSAVLTQRTQLRKLSGGAMRLPRLPKRSAPGSTSARGLPRLPSVGAVAAAASPFGALMANPQAQLLAQQMQLQQLVLEQQKQLQLMQQQQKQAFQQQHALSRPPKLAVTINNPDAVPENAYAQFAPAAQPIRMTATAPATAPRSSLSDRFGMFRSG